MADVLIGVGIQVKNPGATKPAEKDLTDLGNAADKSKQKLSGLEEQANAFAKTMAKGFGFGAGFEIGQKAAELATEAIKAIPEAVISAIEHVTELAHTFEVTASKTGLSVETIQKLNTAAKLTGTSMDAITSGVGKLEKNIGTGNKAFEQMGLSLQTLKNASPDEALRKVLERLGEMPNRAERAAAGAAVLGKNWQELAGIIDNPAALDAGQRLGAVLGTDDVEAAARLAGKSKELGIAWEAVQNQFAAAITSTPELLAALNSVTEGMAGIAKTIATHKPEISAFFSTLIQDTKAAAEEARILMAIYAGGGKSGGGGSLSGLAASVIGAGLDHFVGGGSSALLAAFVAQVKQRADEERQFEEAIRGMGTGMGTGKGKAGYDPAAEEAAKKYNEEQAKSMREYVASYKAMESEITQMEIRTHKLGVDEAKRFWDEQVHMADDYGKKLLASRLQVNAGIEAGDKMLDEAEKAYYAALQHGEPTLATQKALIDANTAAKIRDVEATVRAHPLLEQNGQLSIDMLKKAGEEEKKLASRNDLNRKYEAWGAALRTLGSELAQFNGVLGQMGNILGSLGAMFDGLAHRAKTTGEKIQAGAQAAATAVSIYQQNKYNRSAGSGAMSGAASGAAAGAAFGPYGVVIGAIVGGIIGALSGSAFRDACKKAGQTLGGEVSDALGKAIMQTAKDQKVSTATASLLHISDFVADDKTGNRSITSMGPQIEKLLAGIAHGTIPAKAGMEELNKDFAELATAAAAGDVAAQKLTGDLLQQAIAAGKLTDSMKQFISDAMSGMSGGADEILKGLADIGKKVPLGEFGVAAAHLFVAGFTAEIGQKGLVQAIEDSGAGITDLYQRLVNEGNTAAAAMLAPWVDLANVINNDADPSVKGFLETLRGMSQVFAGLDKLGFVTGDSFSALEQGAQGAFNALTQGGASSKEALQAIAPQLAQIIAAHEKYGIAIDGTTAELIRQATEAGITFAPDPVQAMIGAVHDLIDAIREMNGLPKRDWGPPPPAMPPPGPPPPDPGTPDPGSSYAVGFGYGGASSWQHGPGMIRGDQIWHVHDGELGWVIPKSEVQKGRFRSAAVGFGGGSENAVQIINASPARTSSGSSSDQTVRVILEDVAETIVFVDSEKVSSQIERRIRTGRLVLPRN